MANLAGQRAFLTLQNAIGDRLLQQTALSTSTYPTLARVKEEINTVYKRIYGERPWKWQLVSTTLATVAGTTTYTLPDTVIEPYNMQIRSLGLDIQYISREVFLKEQPYGWTNVGQTMPRFAIPAAPASNNAMQIDFWPTPDAIYTVNYDYRSRFTQLSGDTDIPVIPPEFDDLLVQGPLVELYKMINDERWQGAKAEYEQLWKKMWMADERELNFM